MAKRPILADMFCGGGGTAEGVRLGLGRSPDIAANHNEAAIAMHKANHPETTHVCGDVYSIRPRLLVQEGQEVALLTASPDCRHFSKAKGKPKVSPRVRMLARSVIPWLNYAKPNVLILENVWEFTTWGPLTWVPATDTEEGYWTPNKAKAGQHFKKFIRDIRKAGYEVDWRKLKACDFGAGTSRERLFLIATRNGHVPQWPEPTHGPGRKKPWKTAAECIDWSLPMQSIFDRPRPLAEATQRRIAHGFVRYTLGIGAKPSQKIAAWVERMNGSARGEDLKAPLSTITSQGNHHALCIAIDQRSNPANGLRSAKAPLSTITTKNRHGLMQTVHNGAWIAKNYTGVVGQQLDMPLGTITTRDSNGLVVAQSEDVWMVQTGYGERKGQAPRVLDLHQPLGTIVAGGAKHSLCQAESGDAREKRNRVIRWVERYYSNGGHSSDLELPLPTIRTRGSMALIEARIEELQIVDVLFRMLQPRELARATGLRESYILTGTKEQQIERIGNMVVPQVIEAIVQANMDAIAGVRQC